MSTDDLEMKIFKMIKYDEIISDGLRAIQGVAEKFNAEHLLDFAPQVIRVILDIFFEIGHFDPILHYCEDDESDFAKTMNEYKRHVTLNSAAAALLLVLNYFNIHVNVKRFAKEADRCGLEVDLLEIENILKNKNVKEYAKVFLNSILNMSRSGYPKAITFKLKEDQEKT